MEAESWVETLPAASGPHPLLSRLYFKIILLTNSMPGGYDPDTAKKAGLISRLVLLGGTLSLKVGHLEAILGARVQAQALVPVDGPSLLSWPCRAREQVSVPVVVATHVTIGCEYPTLYVMLWLGQKPVEAVGCWAF